MSITPTTPRDPLSASAQESLDDARNWESAYRHFDEDAVPALLLHLQDDLTRARRREAAWLSVIVHLLVIILFVNQPRLENFYRRVFLHQQPIMRVSLEDMIKRKDVTYLELPPDLQKITKPPDSKAISDKDRVATSATPQVDAKELKKLFASNRPGSPGDNGPRNQLSPSSAAAAPSAAPAPAQQQSGQTAQAQQPQPGSIQVAETRAPPMEKPQVKFGGALSAGSSIEQATRAAAQNRGGYGGDGGDGGLTQGRSGGILGPLEVLTDTMGVDFGPYLNRVVQEVKQTWILLIPEAAYMKKGWVTIDFYILKDGTVAGMKKVDSSGDITLERPAWGGITGSNPFQPLPQEFPGANLGLRFRFFYNLRPDGSDPDVR